MSRPTATTRGASHIALVCSDRYETVKFWEDLGIPLLKLEELPGSTASTTWGTERCCRT
jgi:hypothetical protein